MGKSPFWGIFRIVSFSGTLHWSLLLFVFKQSLVPLDTSQYHMSIKLLSLGSLLTRPSFVRLSQKCYSWKSWEKGKNFFNFVLKTNYDMLFEILIFTFDLGSKFFAILKLANDHIGLKRRYILKYYHSDLPNWCRIFPLLGILDIVCYFKSAKWSEWFASWTVGKFQNF